MTQGNSNPSNQEEMRAIRHATQKLSPDMIEALAAAANRRDGYEDNNGNEIKPEIPPEDKPREYNGKRFKGTEFVAHVQPGMTFNRNGEMVVKLIIPAKFKDAAIELTNAIEVPVQFTVQPMSREESW